MLKVIDKHTGPAEISGILTLPWEIRQKGRFRTFTDAGEETGVFLPRGGVLREGELLQTECGKVLQVRARPERLTEARASDWLTFSRVCYHLGNRHVPLQIGELWVRFQPDHVLQEMVELLGLQTGSVEAGFNPEEGAYSGGHHHHHDTNTVGSMDFGQQRSQGTVSLSSVITGHSHE